ncbi:MAG: hypothetical protein LAO03_06305 [Acidobacteriia bacterium]|nr:hypothetical protein [Terriglobia bacterium]
MLLAAMLGCIVLAGSGCGSAGSANNPPPNNAIVVNSLTDTAQPPAGTMTLRAALDQATSGKTITFDSALDGGTIALSIVGESHSVLKGEVYSGMTFDGYADRDYGKSALYAQKDVVLDASSLPHGITIAWTGGDANPARVLAVYGNLTLKNITVAGGFSNAEAISTGSQPYTLARGGGLAVWGTATLEDCTVAGNRIAGDINGSRDRGAYGGGIYANGLLLTNCVVSGNSAIGYGAAGGGIYSVGGADNTGGRGNNVSLTGCTISGNRVTAQHAYGGGLFTLAGGPNNLATLQMTNCTVARNLVEDNPALPEVGQYYYRGGGIYMGGGSLSLTSCTVAENEVTGNLAIFSGKPNMGGGGVAATIGNAHVVEDVNVWHSIVAGNKLSGAAQDWYSGSLLHFYSYGYNRMGALDFSQILVPVPAWTDLSRKHYPKTGDQDGVTISQVLSLSDIQYSSSVISAGTDFGQPAVLWYMPSGAALDQIPNASYSVTSVLAGYTGYGVSSDDFLNHVLEQIRTDYASILGSDFGSDIGDMSGVTWYESPVTWPTDPANVPWITFWRNLDTEIGNQLGAATLGDDFWGTFTSGNMGNVTMTMRPTTRTIQLTGSDQRGQSRPNGGMGDIGAIEK